MKTALLVLGFLGTSLFVTHRLTGLGGGGAPAGPVVTYYGNGEPKSSTSFEDGMRQGPCTQWHPGGGRESEGSYHRGLREGPWTFWRQDGSVDAARSGLYRAGERVGPLP